MFITELYARREPSLVGPLKVTLHEINCQRVDTQNTISVWESGARGLYSNDSISHKEALELLKKEAESQLQERILALQKTIKEFQALTIDDCKIIKRKQI